MNTHVSGIYMITNIVNGKMLIGQSVNCYNRWKSHRSYLNNNNHQNQHFQRAWNKYGAINFSFEIIIVCPPEKLDEEEIAAISKYDTVNENHGYNLQYGGKSNKVFSEETKQKMSKAKQGSNHWIYGKRHDDETKLKMRERALVSNNMRGKRLTDEQKKAIGEGQRGEKHWRWKRRNQKNVPIEELKPLYHNT